MFGHMAPALARLLGFGNLPQSCAPAYLAPTRAVTARILEYDSDLMAREYLFLLTPHE
jgi:hypothetical protein